MFKSIRVAFFLAPKAIVRGNLGITALTICMLAIVEMNLLFIPGLIDGIISSSNKIMVETYTSDLIIESAEDNPFISHSKEFITELEQINGIAAVSSRNTINAEIISGEERVSCRIIGMDPQKENQVFDISKFMIEGNYIEPRDRDQIVLGVQLAGADLTDIELYSGSLKHIHAGDKVDVTFGNGLKKQYAVKGIFYTRFIQTDIQGFISDIEFQSIMPETKNKASSIRIKLDKEADVKQVISQINAIKDDIRIQTWSDLAGIVLSMTDSFRIINQILNIVNILIAGITVFIVTYVDIVNRKRQIGIQRAIGIKPRSIIFSYLIRALSYAVVGLIAGLLFYKYVMIPLEIRNPFIFPFGPAFLSYNSMTTVRTVVMLVSVSIIASFIPVWRVMRKTILNSIWG